MTPVGHSEVMPVEIGSNVSQTLKTFIADINSFRFYFSTRYTEASHLLAVQQPYQVDIWEGISTVLYPYLISPPVIASIIRRSELPVT